VSHWHQERVWQQNSDWYALKLAAVHLVKPAERAIGGAWLHSTQLHVALCASVFHLLCRLNFIQKFTQPAAYAADLAAQYMGELLYYMLQGAWAVYSELAAMKVLPQITSGAQRHIIPHSGVFDRGYWATIVGLCQQAVCFKGHQQGCTATQ
jgi:hypothetical protein